MSHIYEMLASHTYGPVEEEEQVQQQMFLYIYLEVLSMNELLHN